MDRRERSGNQLAAMIAYGEELQSRLWTALPCIVQGFDPTKKTITAQCALQVQAQKPDGSFVPMNFPPFVDVPVFFPSGGGMTLTFPIKVGDECLVVFASRCIDGWWASGCPAGQGPVQPPVPIQTQPQLEFRMHDLSDGFAFVGISSVPNVPASISTSAVELRNADQSMVVRLNPTSKQIDVTTSGVLNLTAATVNIRSTGNNTNIDGKTFLTHQHSGVQAGGSNTGGVA